MVQRLPRLLLATPKATIPKIKPNIIASHGKPGIADPPGVVKTVETRVVTEVAVVSVVELVVEATVVATLDVVVMVVAAVATVDVS